MCGIAGVLRSAQPGDDRQVVASMLEVLRPRGPDSDGLLVDGPLTLGHRRLGVLPGLPEVLDGFVGLACVEILLGFRHLILGLCNLTRIARQGYRFVESVLRDLLRDADQVVDKTRDSGSFLSGFA